MNSVRLLFHEELCSLLGTRQVYFQPPESIKLQYPAIVYSRSDIQNVHANDDVYNQRFKFKVTVIDHNPDSVITQKLTKLKYAEFDRHYAVNGLNHDQFIVTRTNKK